MLKSFEYNKDYKVIRGKSLYAQECDLLHEFLATDHENLRLEYTTRREATNARATLVRYAERCKMPLKVIQRNNYVFALKEKGGEKQCR